MVLRGEEERLPENGMPPKEVRILDLQAEPWPTDGRRVRVHLHLTPFLERPDLEIVINDAESREVASINIIESIENQMSFTMHIRGPEKVDGQYTLSASVSYDAEKVGVVDQKSIEFETKEKLE